MPDGDVDGLVALGVEPGIDEPELVEPELVPGPVAAGPPDIFESLHATAPATVKQAMAINAVVLRIRIVCSS